MDHTYLLTRELGLLPQSRNLPLDYLTTLWPTLRPRSNIHFDFTPPGLPRSRFPKLRQHVGAGVMALEIEAQEGR